MTLTLPVPVTTLLDITSSVNEFWKNQLQLEWVSTQEQAADLLTKQLTEEKLRIWRDRFLTTVTLD